MLRGRNDTGDVDPMACASMNTKTLSKKDSSIRQLMGDFYEQN